MKSSDSARTLSAAEPTWPQRKCAADGDHRGRVQLHRLAGEEPQVLGRLRAAGRLVEPRPRPTPPNRSPAPGARGLRPTVPWLRQAPARPRTARLAELASSARSSIAAGRTSKSTPGGAEHRAPRGALGREDDHIGFNPTSTPSPCSSRSASSASSAAAVSSIERRVTSITGQPLSANIRRAKATSRSTFSSST